VIQVTVDEAQRRLPQLLNAVESGETASILSDDGRAFRLAPPTPGPVVNAAWPGYPHPGSAKGLIEVPDDCDESSGVLNVWDRRPCSARVS